MRSHRFRRFWDMARSGEGTAAVEFALVLPVILVMLFMTITIGRMYNDYHIATKSVRDATRYLSRADFTILCGSIDQNQIAIDQAKSLALTGKISGNPATEPLIATWTDPGSIVVAPDCYDNTAGAFQGFYAGATNIRSLIVTATVPFNFTWAQLIGRAPTMNFTISQKMIYLGT